MRAWADGHLTASRRRDRIRSRPSMRIGVPKETAAGEHRVALVPEVVGKLKAKGLDVVVQNGAGDDALVPDEAFAEAGARADAATRGEVWRADVVLTIAPPDPEQIRSLGPGSILIGFLAPLTSPQTTQRAGRRGRDGVRDGGDPAYLARAVDGRAVLAGQRRRLQGRAARRRGDGPLLPDADDRRGHDPAGEGARARRRRGRAAGARDRQAPGRAHDRLRRAPGGRRAGAVARRACGWTSAWRPAARAATHAS